MTYKKIIVAFTLIGAGSFVYSFTEAASTENKNEEIYSAPFNIINTQIPTVTTSIDPLSDLPQNMLFEATDTSDEDIPIIAKKTEDKKNKDDNSDVFTVPFYSQFKDITKTEWKKVGCGIASLAMLIEFYEPGSVSVDTLLNEGIKSGAYISDAGWSHAGLINLSKKYGLNGGSNDMSGSTMEAAFSKLKTVLKEGPVMVSVHYTFDPKNPIPHLVVINGVSDGKVYYNDPAEKSGGGYISISKFQSAWKKRYIKIRATT